MFLARFEIHTNPQWNKFFVSVTFSFKMTQICKGEMSLRFLFRNFKRKNSNFSCECDGSNDIWSSWISVGSKSDTESECRDNTFARIKFGAANLALETIIDCRFAWSFIIYSFIKIAHWRVGLLALMGTFSSLNRLFLRIVCSKFQW